MIDLSLRPTERMPWTILRLWGFSCVRDAGHRCSKISESFGSRFLRSYGWPSVTYDWIVVALSTADQSKLTLLPLNDPWNHCAQSLYGEKIITKPSTGPTNSTRRTAPPVLVPEGLKLRSGSRSSRYLSIYLSVYVLLFCSVILKNSFRGYRRWPTRGFIDWKSPKNCISTCVKWMKPLSGSMSNFTWLLLRIMGKILNI